MAQADIAIRGGRIVTGSAEMTADVAISGDTIVQIGGDFEAATEIDASGMLVLPGVIDAHVHLTQPGRDEGQQVSGGWTTSPAGRRRPWQVG